MAESEQLLNVAAGYAEPTAAEAQTLIELGAYYRLRSLARARFWAEQIEAEARTGDGGSSRDP